MAYFSNSSEGSVLDEQCCDCYMGIDEPCPVAFVQMNWNYSQVGNDMAREILNELVSEKGICKMKVAIEKNISPGKIERILLERNGQICMF